MPAPHTEQALKSSAPNTKIPKGGRIAAPFGVVQVYDKGQYSVNGKYQSVFFMDVTLKPFFLFADEEHAPTEITEQGKRTK